MGEKSAGEMMGRIRKFKKCVEKNYGIEKLILFGSAARTDFRKFNDLDFLVVTDRKQRQLSFLPKLYHEWHVRHRIGFPVDFISFDHKTFEKKKREIGIVKVAMEEGVEI